MAENKKTILEVRGMTWAEHCKYAKEVRPQVKDTDPDENDIVVANWIFETIYPSASIDDFSPGEVIAISYRTMALSGEIRTEEIKNLRPSSLGNGNEAAIAEIAEESMSTEK